MQVHASTWNTEVTNKPKLYMLAQYKKHYITEKYCSLNLKRSHRSLIAKLRLGIFPIRIETGRYNGLDRKDRLCLVCKDGNIEDESHVMFQCKAHIEAREILFNEACKIHSQFLNLTEIQKIEFLTSNMHIIRKTAHILIKMLSKRQSLLGSNG